MSAISLYTAFPSSLSEKTEMQYTQYNYLYDVCTCRFKLKELNNFNKPSHAFPITALSC